MRYLKLFENESYTIISLEEYYKFKDHKINDEVKDKVIKKLKSIFIDENIRIGSCIWGILIKLMIDRITIKYSIEIHALDDDYFYVLHKNIFYKCDQISGLSSCIKMLLNK